MSWKEVLKSLLNKQPKAGKSFTGIGASREKDASHIAHSSGADTQFHGIDSSAPHKQLVIGLDFGTAFTKVVVGEERLHITIPLRGEGKKIGDYLLPTVYWVGGDGICALDSPLGSQYLDLKMALLEGDYSDDTIQRAAAYLALVLRRVRAYLFDKKSAVYGGNYIDWMLNVGLPTSSYYEDELGRVYKRMVAAAWLASTAEGDITLKSIAEAWDKVGGECTENSGAALHHEAISLFPEFVAQITGYVRSPLRQSDLHLLVDVGAGTLDATVFNVHEDDGEDRFPIFAKGVEQLGTRFLVRHRIEGTTLLEKEVLGPFAPVPDKHKFSKLLGIDVGALLDKDRPFRERALNLVGSLLQKTKTRFYRTSRRWEQGVPLFLCGGGSQCDFYREIFNPMDGKIHGFPVVRKKLPMPQQLEAPGVSSTDYDRLSVAYGLSFDPFDIGEIIKDVPPDDDAPSRPSGSVECCKCNGTGGLHRPCDHCGGSGFAPG